LEQIDQSVSLSLDNVEALSAQIKLLALQCKDRPLEILHILRVLEQLHSDICSEIFQPALPNSRHALFDLLKEIEAEGGWPHIYHRNLNQLFEHVEFLPSDPRLESLNNDSSSK